MKPKFPIALLLVLIGFIGVPPALADGGGGGGGDDATNAAKLKPALDAIKAERWRDAIWLLQGYTSQTPNDADGFNWLGYAYRKYGQLKPAFTAYRRALVLDPKHIGVHEYIGEAYLIAGEPAKAEEHLRALERLCGTCEQEQDLRKALAEYRSKPGAAAAATSTK